MPEVVGLRRASILLSHCPATPPSHCPTVLLPCHRTVLPSSHPTVPLPHYSSVLPSHCPAVTRSYYPTALLSQHQAAVGTFSSPSTALCPPAQSALLPLSILLICKRPHANKGVRERGWGGKPSSEKPPNRKGILLQIQMALKRATVFNFGSPPIGILDS